MARAIDGDKLVEDLRLIATCWSVSSFVSKEKHNGAIDMLKEVEREVKELPTLTPPNEPLTLDSRLTSKMVTCPKGWQGVRDTRFYCPGCKKVVKKGEAYCHKCGQALIFPVQRYDKENNRIWLDFSDRRPPEGEEENACRM